MEKGRKDQLPIIITIISNTVILYNVKFIFPKYYILIVIMIYYKRSWKHIFIKYYKRMNNNSLECKYRYVTFSKYLNYLKCIIFLIVFLTSSNGANCVHEHNFEY